MQYGGIEPYALEQKGTGLSARGGVFEGATAKGISSPAAQIAANLPFGVGQALYEYLFNEEQKYNIDTTLPVDERVKRYNPILKQLFGTTMYEKTVTSRVLSYYGLDYRDTKIYSGDAGFDRQANIIYQRLIDLTITPGLADPRSNFNTIAQQDAALGNFKNTKLHLRNELRELKKIARAEAKEDNPQLWKAIKMWKDTSVLERSAFDARMGEGSAREEQAEILDTSLQSEDKMGNLKRDTERYRYTPLSQEESDALKRRLYGN